MPIPEAISFHASPSDHALSQSPRCQQPTPFDAYCYARMLLQLPLCLAPSGASPDLLQRCGDHRIAFTAQLEGVRTIAVIAPA
eukprot:scaffold87853_cov32-Tisochrysis_lutea.AAC.1